MDDIGTRLREYLDFKGIKRSLFAEECDIPYNSLTRILNNSRNLSSEVIGKIFNYFPDLNARWFITGKGPMEYTVASYHLDPVLETPVDIVREVDEYISKLPKEDIDRLEEEGLNVKFNTHEIDDKTVETLLKEFIQSDETKELLRNLIKENKEK
ncbi:hypothetical protein [Myroides sp.]|uniref:helix-turn-helix domain-containing protein n=1 Tax=Myroides sp. TaxID=1874736 RepID=UPI003F3A685D